MMLLSAMIAAAWSATILGAAGGALFALGWLLTPGRGAVRAVGQAIEGAVAQVLGMAIAGVLVVVSIFVNDQDI